MARAGSGATQPFYLAATKPKVHGTQFLLPRGESIRIEEVKQGGTAATGWQHFYFSVLVQLKFFFSLVEPLVTDMQQIGVGSPSTEAPNSFQKI